MPLSFFKDSVTRQRATIKKTNGMEYFDWSDPDEKVIPRVQVVPQTTSRVFEERVQQVTDRRTLRASYNADIEAGDRIIWEGKTYEIDGEVFHTSSPTGRVSSTRCNLVRWEG